MTNQQILVDLKKVVYKNYYSKLTVPGHGWDHIERVYKLADQILKTEPRANKFAVQVAVLLHDIGRLSEERGSGRKHAQNSFFESKKLLKKYQLNLKQEYLILQAVAQHSDSSPAETLEGKILQDADKLDCLGAIGIIRSLSHWAVVGKEMFDPKNPFNLKKGQTLEQAIQSLQVGFQDTIDKRAKKYMIECLLKFNNNFITMMHTKKARKLAKRRHNFLKKFLLEFRRDIDL